MLFSIEAMVQEIENHTPLEQGELGTLSLSFSIEASEAQRDQLNIKSHPELKANGK